MTMPPVNPYRLNDVSREIWYSSLLRPLFLGNLEPSEHPTFTLITAQSGAGKTTLSLLCAAKTTPNPLKFSGDDFRKVHPHSAKILREDPDNYVIHTTPDVSYARSRIIEECMQKKFNVQVESVLTNPNDYKMKTLLQAKEYGYSSECVVMGIPYFLSVASMYYRREKQIEQTGYGFPVTMWNHDTSYELLPDIISKMYDGYFVDRVRIVDRQLNLIYHADHTKHQSGKGMKEALEQARNNYIRADTLAYVDNLWKEIWQMMDKRNAPEHHYHEAEAQYKQFSALCHKTGLHTPQLKDINAFVLINAKKFGGHVSK